MHHQSLSCSPLVGAQSFLVGTFKHETAVNHMNWHASSKAHCILSLSKANR